jgi:hypothetical protein
MAKQDVRVQSQYGYGESCIAFALHALAHKRKKGFSWLNYVVLGHNQRMSQILQKN